MEQVKGTELNLGDVIQVCAGPYGSAIVKKVGKASDPEFCYFRPYGTTVDFSYTGGVICYIGLDENTLPKSGTYTRLERGKPLR